MLKAAFYEKDITPPLGGYMWGSSSPVYATEVKDKLYVKAVAVDDGKETVAIACFDSCTVPADLHDFVVKRVAEYAPIKAENICLCSNHTHKGVPITDSPEMYAFKDKAYCDVFYRLVADCIILAYNRLEESEAFFGTGTVRGVSFNRNFLLSDGRMVSHYMGRTNIVKTLAGVDEELPVMVYKNKAGKPTGAIINFALHQDCVGGTAYSGDYSSIISQELKKIYGPDFVSLFVLGTCGDINHRPHNDEPLPKLWYKEIGKTIAEEAVRTIEESKPSQPGGIGAQKKLLKIKRRIYDQEYYIKKIETLLKEGSFFRIRNLLTYEATNDKEYSELYVQVIKLGDVLFYAFPGEVYVNHGLHVKEKSPCQKNIVVSNSNSYCGYIPTRECFGEGGSLYETSIAKHSCHVPKAGEIMREELLSMANKLI
jgi:neutral ceramidase